MPFDGTGNTNRTDADLLREARALIDHPDKWCQHAFITLRATGLAQCTVHALYRATTGDDLMKRDPFANERVLALATQIVEASPLPFRNSGGLVCSVNNMSTHAELMAVFDKAIATAEARHG